MKREVLVLAVFLIVLINLTCVLADGGYFPEPGYWVRPGQQRAIILFEDNTETMILTSGFIGNAKDLVWIVPTPKRPTITKANEEVFRNMAILAQPKYDGGINYGMVLESATGMKDVGVAVIETKKVDYYDVSVLVARDVNDLIKWFEENGYDYPEEYSYVLEHYIQKEWTFTAIKISPESQGATEVIQDLKEGNPTPIKMVFESDKPIFPLKISSVDFKSEDENDDMYYSYRYGVPIQLYVLADEKYEGNSNFYTQYGNWVKKSQIEDLSEDENGDPLIQPKENKYFLTSLTGNLQKSQMDDDLFLKKAQDNKKVNAGPETYQLILNGLLIGVILLIIWVFTPLGIIFIAGALILFLSKNKTARIFGWIMELISLLLTLVIALIFFVLNLSSNTLGTYPVISFLVTALVLSLLMFLVILLELKFRRTR